MQAFKEKKFLVFKFDDGKDVKYDLSNGSMIGKKGNPVGGLSGQLSGYGIREVIDSFQDEKYKQFLNFVYNLDKGYYRNVGTFLKKIQPKSRFEQFFAAGVTNICPHLTYKLNNIPKYNKTFY